MTPPLTFFDRPRTSWGVRHNGWPPFPLPPRAPDLMKARYAMNNSKPTTDQVWLVRDVEQNEKNAERAKSWATRFWALGK